MSTVEFTDVCRRSEPTNHDVRAGIVAMVPFALARRRAAGCCRDRAADQRPPVRGAAMVRVVSIGGLAYVAVLVVSTTVG